MLRKCYHLKIIYITIKWSCVPQSFDIINFSYWIIFALVQNVLAIYSSPIISFKIYFAKIWSTSCWKLSTIKITVLAFEDTYFNPECYNATLLLCTQFYQKHPSSKLPLYNEYDYMNLKLELLRIMHNSSESSEAEIAAFKSWNHSCRSSAFGSSIYNSIPISWTILFFLREFFFPLLFQSCSQVTIKKLHQLVVTISFLSFKSNSYF